MRLKSEAHNARRNLEHTLRLKRSLKYGYLTEETLTPGDRNRLQHFDSGELQKIIDLADAAFGYNLKKKLELSSAAARMDPKQYRADAVEARHGSSPAGQLGWQWTSWETSAAHPGSNAAPAFSRPSSARRRGPPMRTRRAERPQWNHRWRNGMHSD